MDNNEKTVRAQNCDMVLKFSAETERFLDDYYGLAYPARIEEAGGKETFIRKTAQDILCHKTDWLKEELQGIIDEKDDMSAQTQGLLDWLNNLETQIVDTRPEVFPVSFGTFPNCDLSGVEYVLENGEKLRHCTYEPDFFMSENRLVNGTLTTPRFYEAMWDADGLPVSFRRTDEVQIVSQPITGRMEEQAFSSAIHSLLPDSTPEAVNIWIEFAKECVDEEQYVNFAEEPELAATERWLNNVYSGLKAVKEDFGEPIANQVCELAAIRSCLYPGEMCNAAQHFQDGRTTQEISDMVFSGDLDCSELCYPDRKDGFQPENLYCIKIESPYEATGPEIAIHQEGLSYGLIERQTEPGYILGDGTVLLECERDAYGNYKGGAGMDGVFLNTGKLYAPVTDAEGNVQAFCRLHNRMLREQILAPTQEEINKLVTYSPGLNEKLDSDYIHGNYLKTAEMSVEQNYNQIDDVINNQELPRAKEQRDDLLDTHPSILAQLKANAAHCEKQTSAPIQKKETQER